MQKEIRVKKKDKKQYYVYVVNRPTCTIGRSLTNGEGRKYRYYRESVDQEKTKEEKQKIIQNSYWLIQTNSIFEGALYVNENGMIIIKKIDLLNRIVNVEYNGVNEKWDLVFLIDTVKKFYILKNM